ncbi:MAG: DUF3137 domain-containing protein [Verrucomicrobiota bacterium]
MADPTPFREFYATVLLPALTRLEQRRRSLAKIAAGCIALLAVIAGLALFGVRENGLAAYILLGLALLGLAIWFFSGQSAFRHEFKDQIVTAVVRNFSDGLCYHARGSISRARFVDGELFKQRIDRYRGEDHVSGALGATAFEFSEIHAEYKTTTRTKNGTRTTWHTVFKGLYFIADFNKHFSGHTVVLPDSLQSAFGFLGQKLQSLNFTRGELVKLEDPEFEKAFVVYGDDQVEARYILTPALMRRLLELKAKVGGRVYVSFAGSHVHVAIPSAKNHFEPRLFGTLLDPAAIEQYHDDLRLVTGIIEDLNLNTRIWTKA